MSKSVFLSHSAQDKEIASALVELVEGGIGVPEAEIFCSSLDGYGIPTGKNFIEYIKSEIQAPRIVILLLTPSYLKSTFCLCEMGAAWAMSHTLFPIVVPPLTYADVKAVLASTQAMQISDDIKYNDLRDFLSSAAGLHPKSNTKWDIKRRAFLRDLPKLLEHLAVPKEVSPDEHEMLKSKLTDAESTLDEYEGENRRLKGYIERLEKVKNAADVRSLKKEFAGTSVLQEFETKTDAIGELLRSLGSTAVGKFILCDHYGKPYTINHNEDGDDFAEAIRKNVLDDSEKSEPLWMHNKKLVALNEMLKALKRFVESEIGERLFDQFENEHEAPLELNNEEFWEEMYRL